MGPLTGHRFSRTAVISDEVGVYARVGRVARPIVVSLVPILLDIIDYELYEDAGSEYAARIGFHGLLAPEPRGYRDVPDAGSSVCAYVDVVKLVPLYCRDRVLVTREYGIIVGFYEYKDVQLVTLYDALRG